MTEQDIEYFKFLLESNLILTAKTVPQANEIKRLIGKTYKDIYGTENPRLGTREE